MREGAANEARRARPCDPLTEGSGGGSDDPNVAAGGASNAMRDVMSSTAVSVARARRRRGILCAPPGPRSAHYTFRHAGLSGHDPSPEKLDESPPLGPARRQERDDPVYRCVRTIVGAEKRRRGATGPNLHPAAEDRSAGSRGQTMAGAGRAT